MLCFPLRPPGSSSSKALLLVLDAKNATAEGILRTCTVAPQDAANFCDLFKEEVTANYTVTSCSVCDGDKCNGSARFGVSALMGVAAAALLGRGLA